MIPGLALAEVSMQAILQGMKLYDYHLKTKYVKRYQSIIDSLAEEDAKPIYTSDYPNKEVDIESLRDQNKIDRLHLELKVLLEKFVNDQGIKNFENN